MSIRKNPDNLLEKLSVEVIKDIKYIHARLRGANFECYLVGGIVRDLLLGKATGDIDFTTNAHPQQVQKIFPHTIPTGIQHGTVTIICKPRTYEITTYRAESVYSDGRRPDRVEYSQSLSEDLRRRDFTINALVLNIDTMELIDEHQGLNDLKNKLIRTIGNPRDRFFEDGLRTIRACRFRATLGFDLTPDTRIALSDPDVRLRTAGIAIERFSAELYKGLNAATPSAMLQELETSGLRELFMPGLPDTDANTLQSLDNLQNVPAELKLAIWWRSLGLLNNLELQISRAAAILSKKLKFSNQSISLIAFYDYLLHRSLELKPGAYASLHASKLIEIRYMLAQLKLRYKSGIEPLIQSARSHPDIGPHVQTYSKILNAFPLIIADLDLNGQDLMATGLQGAQIGHKLKQAMDLVLQNPDLNQKEILLNKLESLKE